MTRLLNLESCPDAYRYAHLNRSLAASTSAASTPESALRLWYKQWLQEPTAFFHPESPLWQSDRPSHLQFEDQNLVCPEIELGGQDERLYLVADSLSTFRLSQELPGQKYLYSSAYHYWNQIEFFRKNLQKSVVFVDLDRFLEAGDFLVPLSFEQHPNCLDQIPIIDTKGNRSIPVEYNTATLYQAIHHSIAAAILQQNFNLTDAAAIEHLSHYLQRVAFLSRIKAHLSQPIIPFVIEVVSQGTILYREITLQCSQIEAILQRHLSSIVAPLQKIRQHHFVAVVSQYNYFPAIRQLFANAGLMPFDAETQDFSKVWQQKQNYVSQGKSFPLFGFYLDKIEFMIRLNGRDEWLEISAEGQHPISYEGEQKILIGKIPSTGKESFTIKQGQSFARLPIRVNGQNYESQHGTVQEFRVDLAEKVVTEDTEISLAFCLYPDRPPELLVNDIKTQKRLLSQLQDKPPLSEKYGYLPPDKILSDRQAKSEKRIQRLASRSDLLGTYSSLSQLSQFIQQYINQARTPEKTLQLKSLLGRAKLKDEAKLNDNSTGFLHYIDATSNNPIVSEFRSIFSSDPFIDLVQEVSNYLERHDQISNQSLRRAEDKKLLEILPATLCSLLTFIGRTYQFSDFFSTDSLWINLQQKIMWAKTAGVADSYFHCLSRTATSSSLQNQYFNCFNSYYRDDKAREYLWGYGRILMWYFDFSEITQQKTSLGLEYGNHFKQIIQYLDENFSGRNFQPKQNGFLALIYLLTFRKINSAFCQPGTSERQMADQLINRYKDTPVKFAQMDTDKPLNQMFRELLEESASEADVDAIIHGS